MPALTGSALYAQLLADDPVARTREHHAIEMGLLFASGVGTHWCESPQSRPSQARTLGKRSNSNQRAPIF
jgi:hypothetical protein